MPLTGAIARDIGILILSGRYKPGDVMSGEIDASKQFGVSRATYREAMHILCAKGLVERRQRAGTRVNPVESWHWLDPDVLTWTLESEGVSESLSSFFELRRTIEPEVAALAAERHTPEQLAEMAHALEQMRSSKPLHTLSRMPLKQFRTALFRASHNPYLGKFGDLIGQVAVMVDHVSTLPADKTAANSGYAEIFDALSRGDAAHARRAMHGVIDSAWRRISS
jgi:DNA-binding FadR family transcriptional regulator